MADRLAELRWRIREWYHLPGDRVRTWRRPFSCPICDGEGGWEEVVCEYGGSYYPCGWCDGHGTLGVRAWQEAARWLESEAKHGRAW